MELGHRILLGVEALKAWVARACAWDVLSLKPTRVEARLALEEALHRCVVAQSLVVLLLFCEAREGVHHTKLILVTRMLLVLLERLYHILAGRVMLLRLGIGHLLGQSLMLLTDLGLVRLLRQVLESSQTSLLVLLVVGVLLLL